MSDLRGLNFRSLLKKKKCPRIKRKKHVKTFAGKNGAIVVTRLIPWIRIGKTYAWIASLAAGKSRRQINDWLMRRTKRRRVRKMNVNLTGLGGNSAHAIALRQLHFWLDYVPENDVIVFYCESADAKRQMYIWRKWINKHYPDLLYELDENFKCFYVYKPMRLK